MQVCTLLQTDNHASSPPLSFFTGRMPFLSPNQQRQSTEGSAACRYRSISAAGDDAHQYGVQWTQGLKNSKNFEARACIDLEKNLDFINKNVRLD